jgi:hypothetical protein
MRPINLIYRNSAELRYMRLGGQSGTPGLNGPPMEEKRVNSHTKAHVRAIEFGVKIGL